VESGSEWIVDADLKDFIGIRESRKANRRQCRYAARHDDHVSSSTRRQPSQKLNGASIKIFRAGAGLQGLWRELEK
jgi:hypothetical protein